MILQFLSLEKGQKGDWRVEIGRFEAFAWVLGFCAVGVVSRK